MTRNLLIAFSAVVLVALSAGASVLIGMAHRGFSARDKPGTVEATFAIWVLYQGTTLVVPKVRQYEWALSPCLFAAMRIHL